MDRIDKLKFNDEIFLYFISLSFLYIHISCTITLRLFIQFFKIVKEILRCLKSVEHYKLVEERVNNDFKINNIISVFFIKITYEFKKLT